VAGVALAAALDAAATAPAAAEPPGKAVGSGLTPAASAVLWMGGSAEGGAPASGGTPWLTKLAVLFRVRRRGGPGRGAATGLKSGMSSGTGRPFINSRARARRAGGWPARGQPSLFSSPTPHPARIAVARGRLDVLNLPPSQMILPYPIPCPPSNAPPHLAAVPRVA
jgi:hypothetical protein